MNKNLAKKAIILNILAIAIVATLMITATFAWFQMSKESTTDQTVTVGSFSVDLNDTTTVDSVTLPVNIKLEDTFPMTSAHAKALTGVQNRYKFQVKNNGTISAMYKFDVNISVGTELASHIRYDIRYGASGAAIGTATWSGYDAIFNDATNGLQKKLDAYTLNADNTPTVDGKLAKTEEKWFEIIVWIDQDMTLAQLTALNANTTLKFTLTLHAMQSEGGATWTPQQP